ncbi:MAG: recombinase family protein [Coprobacillus cateniformis]
MDNIDINSANGRLFVGILAIIAQWERETIIERTNDGLEEMVRQGKWPYASKPFGYNKMKISH